LSGSLSFGLRFVLSSGGSGYSSLSRALSSSLSSSGSGPSSSSFLDCRSFGGAVVVTGIGRTASLLFEHATVEVGLLAANLDVDHACTALRRGDFDFALGLALQRDFAGRSRALLAAVRTAQERQELHLGVVADHVIRAGDPNPGFIELRQQPLDGYFQYLGKLANSHIRHIRPPDPLLISTPLKPVAPRCRTSAYAPP
jgi:hypothetical protein